MIRWKAQSWSQTLLVTRLVATNCQHSVKKLDEIFYVFNCGIIEQKGFDYFKFYYELVEMSQPRKENGSTVLSRHFIWKIDLFFGDVKYILNLFYVSIQKIN